MRNMQMWNRIYKKLKSNWQNELAILILNEEIWRILILLGSLLVNQLVSHLTIWIYFFVENLTVF